ISLVPTSSLRRGQLRDALVSARTRGIAGRGGRLESALVVAEVALAVVMAAGAGLLIHTVTNLYAIDPGVSAEHVGVVDIVLQTELPLAQRQQAFREAVLSVRAMPGVRMAGAVQKLPLRGSGWTTGLDIEGRDELKGATTFIRLATPGYFETMGIPVRQGRVFTDADRADGRTRDADGVLVINEALAEKYFGTDSPIGRRVSNGFGGWGRVIGVVGNVAEATLTEAASPVRYFPFDDIPFLPNGQVLVFQAEEGRDPASLLEAARRAIQGATPSVAVQQATTMSSVVTIAVGPARQVMTLVTVLTSLALALGAIGIYGVISHYVSRRQRDWGVRIALGMKPANVLYGIVARGAALVGLGIAIGLPAFAIMTRILSSLLYGVGQADPTSLGGAILALLAVGILAALIPAARASRTDPAHVLREQ
ncbi:MAG: ABC transporter permease, partial [Gemmatimonadaceae bacterium]